MVASERYTLPQHEVVPIEIELVGVVEDHGSFAGLHKRVRFGKPNAGNIRGATHDTPDFRESTGVSQARVIERKLKLPVHQGARVEPCMSRAGHERNLGEGVSPLEKLEVCQKDFQ